MIMPVSLPPSGRDRVVPQVRRSHGGDALDVRTSPFRLTPRQRLEALFDGGSFEELNTLRAVSGEAVTDVEGTDGVITAFGFVGGRPVCAFTQDASVCGGTLSGANGTRIVALLDRAICSRVPIVGLNDSGGGRIQDGFLALASYGDIFMRNTQASGVIPQISAIMGPCAGGAAYSPALTDFTVMVEGTSFMFVTGPRVIKAVTAEETTKEELGGTRLHTSESGVAHFGVGSDQECLDLIRELLSFLPSNNGSAPPRVDSGDPPDREEEGLDVLIPPSPYRAYEVRDAIHAIVDDTYFLEVHQNHARNIVVGFGRLAGQPVGIIANQPMHLAGSLDVDASVKAARFVRFCDAFNIPIVTLVDAPGFLPGVAQERAGIIRHGAKLLHAYAEATVPKVTVILRKAYGGAYAVMGSKHLGGDFNFSWPSGEIAIMGPEGAVSVLYSREISAASDPEGCRAARLAEFRASFTSPYSAMSHGLIDDIIPPRCTRRKLIRALSLLSNKVVTSPPHKHRNPPL